MSKLTDKHDTLELISGWMGVIAKDVDNNKACPYCALYDLAALSSINIVLSNADDRGSNEITLDDVVKVMDNVYDLVIKYLKESAVVKEDPSKKELTN